MPAAAVIPAPIVYIKVAAVKKLVVGFRSCYLRLSALKSWGSRVAVVFIIVHWDTLSVCAGC